jgi:hypothetical protein
VEHGRSPDLNEASAGEDEYRRRQAVKRSALARISTTALSKPRSIRHGEDMDLRPNAGIDIENVHMDMGLVLLNSFGDEARFFTIKAMITDKNSQLVSSTHEHA